MQAYSVVSKAVLDNAETELRPHLEACPAPTASTTPSSHA